MQTSKYLIRNLAILVGLVCVIHQESHSLATGSPRKPKADQLASARGQNCTNHLQIIDKCSSLATYSYTTSFNPYPTNLVELKTSCDRISEGIKCLKTHSKCLSNLARRSVTSYTSARNKHSKKICGNLDDPKTIEFVKSAECIKDSGKTELMIANERELISTIQMLAVNRTMKWDDRFHQACCSASNYQVKVIKDIQPQCSKYKEAVEEMLDSMIGELLETACPEPKRLVEICAKLPKLTLVKDWKAASLTSAALDLIVDLADDSKPN